jgi:molybdenum cofactor synthesis domain-containing protein
MRPENRAKDRAHAHVFTGWPSAWHEAHLRYNRYGIGECRMAEHESEIVTAAILVIGDEILSGRTKDKNIGYIAEYLTGIGVDLKEVRVVPDEEQEIVAALNALRKRYSYVFTTGGIGPTHDDITADSVAKAFGVSIDHHPEAVELIAQRVKERGQELNEARLRMARIPKGATLVENKVSAAPGFRIENVIVMAGVPSIMQAMLDAAAPGLKTGAKIESVSVRADLKEGDLGTELGELARAHPATMIGSYPFFDETTGPNTNVVIRSRDAGELRAAKKAVEEMIARVKKNLGV